MGYSPCCSELLGYVSCFLSIILEKYYVLLLSASISPFVDSGKLIALWPPHFDGFNNICELDVCLAYFCCHTAVVHILAPYTPGKNMGYSIKYAKSYFLNSCVNPVYSTVSQNNDSCGGVLWNNGFGWEDSALNFIFATIVAAMSG